MNIQRIHIKQDGMILNATYQGKSFSVSTEGETYLKAVKRIITMALKTR